MTRNCQHTRRAWSATFDQSLSPDTAATDHLTKCPECQAFAQATQATRAALRSVPLGEPDAAADARVLVAFRAQREQRRSMGWSALEGFLGWRSAGAGIASFALTLSLGAWLTRPTDSAPAPARSVSVTSPDPGEPSTGVAERELERWLTTGRRWPVRHQRRTPTAPAPISTRPAPQRGASLGAPHFG